MKIPKRFLDILTREPKVVTRAKETKVIQKFNETIPIGSVVWLEIGEKLHRILKHPESGIPQREDLINEIIKCVKNCEAEVTLDFLLKRCESGIPQRHDLVKEIVAAINECIVEEDLKPKAREEQQ